MKAIIGMQLLEQRKTALMAEGLFDETRKRPLPQFPQKIGIITSPTGAVIQDMLHRLRARFPVQVLLWPTLVQGEGASAQIAAAIQGMNQLPESQKPDVLIIARGGGSLEDLWAFNEEELVRAVAASGIPTISGVGHEPDVTLCDYAADLRAPTPTAAAELAVPVLDDILYTLGQQQNRLHRGVTRYLQTSAQRLDYAARQLPRPDVLLRQTQQQVAQLHTRLQRGMQHVLELKKQQVKSSAKLLESYAPQAPLKRGYAFVTRDGARDFVTSVAGATGTVTVHFHDGSKQATLS